MINSQIEEIRRIEAVQPVGPGKVIHAFSYRDLDLRLDRDVTGTYRVTIHEGKERVYSFTIKTPYGDYDGLRAGYQEILRFLDSDRSISNLPDQPDIKGFFYGHGSE